MGLLDFFRRAKPEPEPQPAPAQPDPDLGTLRRPIQPMPEFVRQALEERGMMDAYHARPPYQRNDYLGWIARAKRQETKEKRLRQMLDELERGELYMNMAHRPRT